MTGVDDSLYVAAGASDAVGVGARRPRREAWPRLRTAGHRALAATFAAHLNGQGRAMR